MKGEPFLLRYSVTSADSDSPDSGTSTADPAFFTVFGVRENSRSEILAALPFLSRR